MSPAQKPYRAGQPVEDHCRQCHEDRMHTVIVVDGEMQPIRVRCDYCASEHNYRGGPRQGVRASEGRPFRPAATTASAGRSLSSASDASAGRSFSSAESANRQRADHQSASAPPLPLVSERERQAAPVTDRTGADLELLLRRIIREEAGLTPVAPADKWRGGEMVLRPGRPGLQEKTWPIETFFHKVVMLRNRLRTLEQQVNASDLPEDQKVRLQGYITGCYGSLTSFNVLFADEDDKFVGAAQE
jgi:hypothetical protein